VKVYGGLARHPKTTPDSFTLVLCHELGHHLAGSPKWRWLFGRAIWISIEGQADYFATLKCARELWQDEDSEAIVAAAIEKRELPPLVTEKCQKAFDSPKEIALCQRTALAGKALSALFAETETGNSPDFDRPDPAETKRTFENHPKAQCRLDTYFAGAVCAKSKDEGLSDEDPTVGTCSQERGDILGVRPLCWYLPQKKSPDSNWPQR
jgi:hypothetical protein